MGLLSAFGVGGGKLSIQPASATVQAGGMLTGRIVFVGGKRAQNVTAIHATLTCNTTRTVAGANGPEQRTQSQPLAGPVAVSGPFQSQPGQPSEFGFSISIPPTAQNSTPGHEQYHLTASADIDGEIDPGASCAVTILGGQQAALGPAMNPVMGAPMPLAVGSPVVAQWQDGGWYPGTVVAMQNGMIGVDWTDPNLGASSWVQPQQVRPAQGSMPMPMPGGPIKHVAAGGKDVGHGMPASGGKAAYAGQHGYEAKGSGVGGHADPYAHKAEGFAAKGAHDAKAHGAGFAIGTPVMAQWQDGNWHAATIVAMQNGYYGVDWENPKLGESSWVQPHQLAPR